MKYTVIKPFQDLTGFKQAGDPVELDDWRAAKLRRMGLIGGRYEEPVRTALPVDVEVKKAVRGSARNKSEFTTDELEDLVKIYPESKVYAKKLADKKSKKK